MIRKLHLVPLLLFTMGSGPCSPHDVGPPCENPQDCRLYEAAAVAGVRIGFHDENGAGGADGEIAAAEGDAFTNHGVSWAALQPTRESVSSSMDPACAFSAEHGLFQVGFHYAWNQLLLDDIADWVLAIDDPDELRDVLRERVRIIFEGCPGIDRLDVINEPLRPFNGTALFPNHFFQVLGPDYIAELFGIVREEAPAGVELFLNENFVEYNRPRAEAFVALVHDLVEGGAPVDAVGIQTHLLLGEPDFALYREILERVADLGLDVFVSELDVPVPPDLPDRFAIQAVRYRRVVETCLAVPACDTIIVWGIDDANTWLHSFDLLTGPDPAPLLFDEDLQPKAAYFAVRDALLLGRGGDHPIAGERLTLAKHWRERGMIFVSSRDDGVVTPSRGSVNDPRRADSDGATIELLRPNGERHTIDVPPGAGWSVGDGETTYAGGWIGGPQREIPLWLRMREGVGLEVTLWESGFSPLDAAEGLGVRITIGSLRLCLDFPAETIAKQSSRLLVAEESARPEGYDCSTEDEATSTE